MLFAHAEAFTLFTVCKQRRKLGTQLPPPCYNLDLGRSEELSESPDREQYSIRDLDRGEKQKPNR